MDSKTFVFILVITLGIIYIYQMKSECFTRQDQDMVIQSIPQPVNYNTRAQNCDELTFSPVKCEVETAIPSNKVVCGENLTPQTNNLKECGLAYKKNKKTKSQTNVTDNSSKNPLSNPLSNPQATFNLEASFNNAQINSPNNMVTNDLMTDVRSLNSLENDLISNY